MTTAVYNLFYDGLPKEIQDHIYEYDSTYVEGYTRAVFRNEIRFIHKLRNNYDYPSFIIQSPYGKTGADIVRLAEKIQNRLNDETVFYPYNYSVSQTKGIAFENDEGEVKRLQFYHRAFPVPLELISSTVTSRKSYDKYDPVSLTETHFSDLLNHVSPKRFPSFKWPFYEAQGNFSHTYDITLMPQMCLFQMIFRNNWTFGEIQRTAKCFKEEGFGVMYVEDYESCINGLRGIPQRPMFLL